VSCGRYSSELVDENSTFSGWLCCVTRKLFFWQGGAVRFGIRGCLKLFLITIVSQTDYFEKKKEFTELSGFINTPFDDFDRCGSFAMYVFLVGWTTRGV
jgi:hypothetical protein